MIKGFSLRVSKAWRSAAKYLQIFKINFQEEFAYKFNFIMWRVRNVFQILLTFFLWDTIFDNPTKVIFGYDRSKILTYVFGIIIVRALVMSARAADIASDIAQGDLSNYLLKPVTYFRYWFTRDVSSKAINLIFAAIEFTLLFIILKPPFYFQSNPLTLIFFLIGLVLAIFIYFFILILVSSLTFWAPELSWGGHFLITVVLIEALSGSLFPINILPTSLQSVIMATPFPYLIYFPVQIYLGNITGQALVGGLMLAAAWCGILWFAMNFFWQKGLKVYEATGR
ncbi:MAG TPA: ABC-2 family transporter protein [Patescibacteria group bacterium]|nr:ABC-2 family transporter protein [Patescibacteria group bacterium]